MKIKFQMLVITALLVTNCALGQQHKVGKPIMTVIKAKGNASSNPNWVVYSDVEMNKKVGSIKVGDSVDVVGWATWLYFIKSQDLRGYISWRALEVNNNLDSLSKILASESSIEEELQIKKDKELATKNHEQMLIKKFGNSDAQKILMGEYWIGMTASMAMYSLGQPDTKNNSVSATSTREQWVYRKEKIYLYFNNYVLQSYQD